MIKVQNDGILITSQDNIVLFNKSLDRILNIEKPIKEFYKMLTLTKQLYDDPNEVIQSKKQIVSKLEKCFPEGLVNQPFTRLGFSHLWSYIKLQKHSNDLSFVNFDFLPFDGIFFTLKDKGNKTKQLLVFSQILDFGTNKLKLTTIRDMS